MGEGWWGGVWCGGGVVWWWCVVCVCGWVGGWVEEEEG